MAKSTQSPSRRKAASDRPPKPYPDFPLCPHPAGYWCKSIRGKVHYFARWGKRVNGKMERLEGDGWQAALEEYEATRDALYAGRTPRARSGDGLTLADLCNRFLTSKQRLLDAGELSPRTFRDYNRITDRLVAFFGKARLVDDLAADDFDALRADIARSLGPARLGSEVNQTRMVFKFGYDSALLDRPMRFGPSFKRPSAAVLRKARNGAGPKMFEAAAVRRLLEAAGVQLRAMILLQLRIRQRRLRNPAHCGLGLGAWLGRLPQAQDRHRPPLPALARDRGHPARSAGRAQAAQGCGRRGAGVPHQVRRPMEQGHVEQSDLG